MGLPNLCGGLCGSRKQGATGETQRRREEEERERIRALKRRQEQEAQEQRRRRQQQSPQSIRIEDRTASSSPTPIIPFGAPAASSSESAGGGLLPKTPVPIIPFGDALNNSNSNHNRPAPPSQRPQPQPQSRSIPPDRNSLRGTASPPVIVETVTSTDTERSGTASVRSSNANNANTVNNNVNRTMGGTVSNMASNLRDAIDEEQLQWQCRDSSASLGASIGETYEYLARERPEMLEEDAVRRAVELSLLDCALVLRSGARTAQESFRRGEEERTAVALGSGTKSGVRTPEEVLRIRPGASLEEIRAAYRRRARETHPDKGGRSGEFESVARAYRSLLDASAGAMSSSRHSLTSSGQSDHALMTIKGTAHWDNELREHRSLVRELFQAHGADMGAVVSRQESALARLGLKAGEAGSRGRNEKDEIIKNSCFYLSLAVSYLSGIGVLQSRAYKFGGGGAWRTTDGGDGNNGNNGNGNSFPSDEEEDDPEEASLRRADEALTLDSALQLKRIIEAAVVSSHPEWAAEGLVGEEVQAFSDFLVYVLDSPTLASEWAVAVFDAASGFVDVYKGKNFPEGDEDDDWSRINTLTIRYEPGHYRPILPESGGGGERKRPALKEVLEVLNEENVIYVVTDGSA